MRDDKQQQDEPGSSRSPLANQSPATRQPRSHTPPPTYSETVADASGPTMGASSAYTAQESSGYGRRANPREDPLSFLSRFDTVFLIDDSASMRGRSWREAQAALTAIVPVCMARDEDGVDVYFLNNKSGEEDEGASAGTGHRKIQSADRVTELFRNVGPHGNWTLTGMRLQRILQTYLRHYENRVKATQDETCVKPINIIVITDGMPHDEPADIIRDAASRLDAVHAPPYQVGIQFFQVGDDPWATNALRELDDNLRTTESGVKLRDMVDTVTFDSRSRLGAAPALSSDGILKTVLGAVNRRLDRKNLERPR